MQPEFWATGQVPRTSWSATPTSARNGAARWRCALRDSTSTPRPRRTPIASWRRRYRTGEGQIVTVLEEATLRHPAVAVGSYPRFLETGPEVEVVLKSTDVEALTAATQFVESALVDVRVVAG